MEDHGILMAMGVFFASMAGSYWFWRRRWFIRNPHRTPPAGDNIVSPADGTVVYVKELHPHEEVLIIKKGLEASVSDIVREDAPLPKLLIGVL